MSQETIFFRNIAIKKQRNLEKRIERQRNEETEKVETEKKRDNEFLNKIV